jgi:hypothetical protein
MQRVLPFPGEKEKPMPHYVARAFGKWITAVIILMGIAFLAGMMQPNNASRTVETIQNNAYETTPGPYGSGVLGDWTVLSHGLYCFQPGTTPADTAYTKAPAKTSPASSAYMACEGEDIRVYGDSITFGGKSALAAELNKLGKTVFIDAWSGRPTGPAVDALVAETVLPPDVVMAVGSNDIFNPKAFGAQVQRAENFIAGYNATHGTDVQLWWVSVQVTRWNQTDVIERNDQRNSMSVNMDIYQRIPAEHVIDWAGRFMDNPSLLDYYLLDGTHPDPAVLSSGSTGYQYWAAVIRGWLQTFSSRY